MFDYKMIGSIKVFKMILMMVYIYEVVFGKNGLLIIILGKIVDDSYVVFFDVMLSKD